MEDEPRSERPCKSKTEENVTNVRAVVLSDRRFTVRMVGSELILNRQTVQGILTEELGRQKICAKLIPEKLTKEQKENWRNVCLDVLERIEYDEKFFKNLIIGDETCIFEYHPETKRQSSEWHTSNSPSPKKIKMIKSKIKSILICFFDSKGSVQKEFVPQGQIFNQQCYRDVLERLWKRVHRVRPEITDTLILHMDNTPCHTAKSANEFLTKTGIPGVLQSPYSPDLSSCVFSLSPNSNSTSKVVILELWTKSKSSWQTSWGHFHMKTSSTATESGSNVSDGLWLPKGTTLKGITLICSSVVHKKNYSISLITF